MAEPQLRLREQDQDRLCTQLMDVDGVQGVGHPQLRGNELEVQVYITPRPGCGDPQKTFDAVRYGLPAKFLDYDMKYDPTFVTGPAVACGSERTE